jgi:hypothetical protein
MKIRDKIISRLRRKGELTIVETDTGSTVAIKSGEHVVTLQNQNADSLLAELEKITADWPSICENKN